MYHNYKFQNYDFAFSYGGKVKGKGIGMGRKRAFGLKSISIYLLRPNIHKSGISESFWLESEHNIKIWTPNSGLKCKKVAFLYESAKIMPNLIVLSPFIYFLQKYLRTKRIFLKILRKLVAICEKDKASSLTA